MDFKGVLGNFKAYAVSTTLELHSLYMGVMKRNGRLDIEDAKIIHHGRYYYVKHTRGVGYETLVNLKKYRTYEEAYTVLTWYVLWLREKHDD